MSEAIVRDFEVRIGRKLKEREAGVLSELVGKAERERDELKAENNLFREWMGNYIEDLKKLVGSATWKKVVEGSINPNFKTIIERAQENERLQA